MRVQSPDGTLLNTVEAGTGDTVVLVPGTTFDAAAMSGVSTALSDRFTVHALDRRGRGGSGDLAEYRIEREFEDVHAILTAFPEPPVVFGHSFGAICCLEAVLLGAPIHALVLYEPPLALDGPTAMEPLRAASRFIDEGEPRRALRTLLRDVVKLSAEEMAVIDSLPDEWFTMFAASAWREMNAVDKFPVDLDRYRHITAPTLLLLGTDSPTHVRRATKALGRAIQSSATTELLGHAHNAVIGAPDLIADHIAHFVTQIGATE